MLTLANSNTTQAKTYYKKENYYSQKDAEVNSQWQRQSASKNQLSGAIVDMDVYENIVNGLSPDGKTQLREKQNHKGKKERAGIDLTFSAPKSVSIACLVGGDKRLEEAHRNAVTRTIDLIESRYATTRINKQPVQTDNLIVAKWHHDTSRELDPHLHTHCLVMNCTQGPDGKWRSISNKAFYQNKILLGQIYRNELANECRKLGYEIESHPKELFEIKGYTRKQIEGFSKRHEQIKGKLEEIGAELTTENKVWAWRKTRAKKNHEIGREEKLPYWHEEADLYSIKHPVPQQSTVESNQEEIAFVIEAAVSVGIEHCSERKVAFKSEDIEKFVTAEVKPFSIHELENAIAQHPELIKTFDGRYTTQSALARELATIKLMQEGKEQVKAITTQETINSYLKRKTLTSGQKEAIALTATTTDQFIAWQGVAGAGKTYALNQVKQVATALNNVAPGYTIKGFAPSAEAAKVLREELSIEASTVASLLVSKQKEDVEPNQIWIVDEAGLLGAKNAYSLLQRAKTEQARVILVGDIRQLSAIEAGNPFKSLQSSGIATAHLNESLRQKPPELQKAVSLTAAGLMAEAITYLEQLHRIKEVVDVGERATYIATDYIRLSPEERQQTLIIAGTHKERKAITNEIRTALKEEETIGYSVEATQLRAKQNITSIQTRYTHNYNIGDVVVPVRDYKRLKIYKSQQYTVVSIIGDKLVLSNLAGNHQTVDPMKFRKTLYKQENIEIAVGDRFKWTRNDKELGRRNGQEFTVIGINGQTATIKLSNGETDSIHLHEPLHLDYALVSTTYSSQGKTANRVLISSTVDRTVSTESVYVAISRAKYDLKIYAEDIDFLLEKAQESKAQEMVLELLQPKAKVQVAEKSETTIGVGKKVEKATNIAVVSDLRREETNAFAPPTIVKKQPPKQLEIFWTPISAIAPLHIEANHWQELVEGSAIHPAIASLNFRSLQMESIEQEHEAWEYLMYSDKLERTNIGQLTTGMLKRYAHIDAGGWWCDSGVNAISFSLETGKPSEKRWGCYKPNEPRSSPNKLGKKIKYEHPPKVDLGIFLLHVPDEIAQRIYEKVGVDPNSEDRMRDFWYCAWKYNLLVTITEGAKKAASLLSQGHAAIGLPGIYAGYRSKDEQGKPIKAHLHEELAVFATLGRNINFCFDYETRPETKRNIEIAISRTGSLLQQQGARVSVVSLLGPEKGVDDLIVVHSPLAYEQAAMTALPLKQWRKRNKQERHLVIVLPKKLSVQEREEKLKNPILGQQPTNQQNLDQSPDHISHGNNEQRQINQNSTDGRHNFVDSDRQLDTEYGRSESSKHQLELQRRTVESAERTSLAGEQRTEQVHSPAVERQSLGREANAQRLHRSVQGSAGETEIGQTQRNNIRASYSHEPSLDQAGGYEPSTDASQRTSNGSLRGNCGQQEAISSDRRTELTSPNNDEQSANGQWGESLEELAQLAQSVNVERFIGDANLDRQLAALAGQINNLNLLITKRHEFTGLTELAQFLIRHQSEGNLVQELAQIEIVLSGLISNVTASTTLDDLQPEIETLAQAVSSWQSEAKVEQAIAKASEVIQQVRQKHSFDLGELPELLSEVQAKQLLQETVLDIASLTQRLAQFTSPELTAFNDMNALVQDLRSYQASSQLMQTGIVERVNVIAQQITELHQVGENKFDDNKSLTELALAVSSFNTQQQLLLEGGLLEQLQQSTSNTISAISRYVDQAKKDSKMLQTAKDTKTFTKPHKVIPSYNQDTLASLANQLRQIPLEEIAIRLGLTLDKHDKHKWRGDGQILSINNQKFYDHLTLTGGYGAIDLVMHVQGQPFKEALKWLTDGLSELPRTYNHLTQPKAIERQPFQPPTGDNSKWLAVREYLVTKRKLPAALVDKLHSQEIIYADSKQNAVFLRQDIKSNITGASLRGTYKDSSFKGLATGSQRENGWFTFVQGEGELKRIVLVESAIDALSAAALAEQPGKAMFISTDGAGSVPVAWLLQQQGVVIIAAHDSDRAGEEMAWRLLTEISSVTRAIPTYGKDWNEQLKDMASKLDALEWRLVAQAIGKPDAYISRIVEVIKSGQLSREAQSAMQQDLSTYKQLSSNLWQWHQAARSSGYSEAYLKRIAEVAIALHHPQKPISLSESARQAMKQEIQNYSQVNRNYHRL